MTIIPFDRRTVRILTFGPDVNLPRLLAWLERAEGQPMLWEATA